MQKIKKKILITGANGFVGKNLTNLLKKKYTVYAVDYLSNQKHTSKEIINLNLVNKKLIFKFFKNKTIDYIFHLASISDIDYSVKYPKKTLQNNINSLLNILELAVEKKIKRIIFSSTIYAYSKQGSFYRISKLTCEELLQEYNRLYNLQFVVIRYGSIYGFDKNNNNSILKMINQAVTNKNIIRLGNGNEKRYFIHIDDVIKITEKMMFINIKKNRYFDILGCQVYSIKDVIKLIKNILPDVKVNYNHKVDPHHYSTSPKNKDKYEIKKIYSKKRSLQYDIKKLIDHSKIYT